MSNLAPPPTDAPLTPNTLSEAEAALQFNGALQTASAGAPQPNTPGPSRRTSNYAAAAHHSGLSASTPFPASFQAFESTDSGSSEAHEDDEAALAAAAAAATARDPGLLSRGTTQAVLEKMASRDFGPGAVLAKRLGRDAPPRASVQDDERAEKAAGVQRQMSWSSEDRKRAMSERLMAPVGQSDSAGYSSAGGGT